jgi:N-acetylmuramoyl-L-alanine amidase
VKRYFILFGIFLLCSFFLNEAFADKKGVVTTVVLDAGHGGRDPGAIGSKSFEKDIALAIALKVGEYINQNLPDVKVIYTRKTDEFIPLNVRAEIANKNKADLFISIHCNASPSSKAYGAETFVMGLHKSNANLEVAKLENAAILYEDDYLETYEGYDPNSTEAHIIFSLYQNAYLNQSIDIASLVQNQFKNRVNRHDRGVKQAPFIVLWRVTMPAILVEVGFIDNLKEEEYLISETGQTHLASAIFRAFRDYKQMQDNFALGRPSIPFVHEEPVVVEQKPEQVVKNNNNIVVENQNSSNNSNGNSVLLPEDMNQVFFKVQFAAARVKKPFDSPDFDGLEKVDFYFHDGLYKYTVGKEKTLQEAISIQEKMQQIGYKDAFVVAFYNNERITAAEALRLMQANN